MKYSVFSFFFIAILIFSSCKDQEVKNDVPNEQTKSYLTDYDEFTHQLIETHPAPFKFIAQSDFENVVKNGRDGITNDTNKKEFIWILSEVIASIGCSHTSLGFFNQQSELVAVQEQFPIQVRWIKNKLYAMDAMINSNSIDKGQEITNINGVPVVEIMTTIYNHINSQAYVETARKEMFNAYATTYIPYALNFPNSYAVTLGVDNKEVVLSPLKEKPEFPPMISPKSPCQKTLCLNEIDNETALLTIRSFAYYGERTPVILNFLDESFKEIEQKKYKNLIIDIRGNFGGTSDATVHLLRYTLQKPFRYFANDGSPYENEKVKNPFENGFSGNLIITMNGIGNSAVGHLVSIYRDRNRATLIGETLGSNQFCTANQKEFTLSNTKINYRVAQSIFFTDVKEKDPRKVIQPDYEIVPSIDDYLTDKDVILEYSLALLSRNTKTKMD